MNSAYAQNGAINVTRVRYNGKTHANAENKTKNETAVSSPRTVSECGGIKEKYRVSGRASVPVRTTEAGAPVVSGTNEKTKGFVYVEHSGVKGTFKDWFCTMRVKSEEKSCFDKVVLILMFAVLMFFVAGSYCEYYDTFRTSKDMQSQIAACRDDQSKLLVAIEERNNKLGIEEYATETLGMVRNEKITKHYINISEKDVVNIKVNEEGDSASNGVLLSGFKNVIANFVDGN